MSINTRLGALVAAAGVPDPGEELVPLGPEWLNELVDMAQAEEEDMRRAREEEDEGDGYGGGWQDAAAAADA